MLQRNNLLHRSNDGWQVGNWIGAARAA